MVSGDSPVRRRGEMRKEAPWSSPTWRSCWGAAAPAVCWAVGEEEEELWRRRGVVVMVRGRTRRPRVAVMGRSRVRRGGIVNGSRGVLLWWGW
jgi:hypothetical protein